jgi:signal transduction histidine kinase
VLLHDRDITQVLPSEVLLGAMTSTWAGAVHAAARYEEAQHFNQRLAEVSRSLAEAQSRLTEAESLARLGEMTAGAAHEMNNPLTIISGRSQLLAGRLTDLRDRAAATAIAEAADDLSDLISSLNLIAEPPRPRPQATQAARIVADAVGLAHERLGSRAPIRTRVAPELPACLLDRELISRALCELIVNAVEAAPDTEVEVRLHADDLDGRLIFTVTDRGPGLSPRALHHAFDAFFSEKPAGRQRGLGLTRARRLVQACDGRISLTPGPTQGTIATIELDSWRPPADITSSSRRSAAA